MSPSSSPTIDSTTILSLLGTVLALSTAYLLSLRLLPRSTSTSSRVLFIWHAFDAVIHAIFEGSFLWNCFFVSIARSNISADGVFEPLPPGVHWLNDPTRLYGAFYGHGPFSRLWQEYARADRRWGGSDTGVVSLELLTVLIGAPLAACCAEGVRRGAWRAAAANATTTTTTRHQKKQEQDEPNAAAVGISGRAWFWMTVLATGELYGGWMTFCPEWLTGSPNLDTSNWMYMYLYLCFFNLLWVALPLFSMRCAYVAMRGVGAGKEKEREGKKRV